MDHLVKVVLDISSMPSSLYCNLKTTEQSMNVQEVAKGFPSNPAIIQDVRITGKESVAALRSKENHLFFPIRYCNGWVWL